MLHSRDECRLLVFDDGCATASMRHAQRKLRTLLLTRPQDFDCISSHDAPNPLQQRALVCASLADGTPQFHRQHIP